MKYRRMTYNTCVYPRNNVGINSGDVEFGRGLRKQRKRVERKKKTKEGKRVLKLETELSKIPLTSCSSIQQFAAAEEVYHRESASLRKFYSSAERVPLHI